MTAIMSWFLAGDVVGSKLLSSMDRGMSPNFFS